MNKTIRKIKLFGALLVAVTCLAGCLSPLQQAAKSGDFAEAERLIKEGADVNAINSDGAPLHFAAIYDKYDLAELLIAKGADVNLKTKGGWTPLHFVRSKDIAQLLISKGANVYAKDAGGSTPADYSKYFSAETSSYLQDVMSGKVKIAVTAPPEDPAEATAFAAEAEKYRALTTKPELPEEARRYNVQAMAAVRDKQFSEAAGFYADASKIAPWWPDWHFNRALVLAELNRFEEASREMKRYLQLVPGAPNARAAQDKIYEWERFFSK